MASAAPTAHVARVRALYRQGLRTILNWAVDREVFYVEADRLRTAFEGNRHLTLPLEIEKVVADGEKTLAQMAHPDPYTVPWRPGGSKFARNPPLPDVSMVNDFGRTPY